MALLGRMPSLRMRQLCPSKALYGWTCLQQINILLQVWHNSLPTRSSWYYGWAEKAARLNAGCNLTSLKHRTKAKRTSHSSLCLSNSHQHWNKDHPSFTTGGITSLRTLHLLIWLVERHGKRVFTNTRRNSHYENKQKGLMCVATTLFASAKAHTNTHISMPFPKILASFYP